MGVVARFLDGLSGRTRVVLFIAGLLFVLLVGVVLGQRGSAPEVVSGGDTSASAASTSTLGVPDARASVPPGDSADITSSTGVDYGVELPRLNDSQFAQTTDPAVFAASVVVAMGYDYSDFQPEDVMVEADRINSEISSGMTGSDGPLGADIHSLFQETVTSAVDLDKLQWRIDAREHDSYDVTRVETLSNDDLHADVGDDAGSNAIQKASEGTGDAKQIGKGSHPRRPDDIGVVTP